MERVRVIGPSKCQGLMGFHDFSGADWCGKFVGISKKTCRVHAYVKLDEEDPVVHSFKDMEEGMVPGTGGWRTSIPVQTVGTLLIPSLRQHNRLY